MVRECLCLDLILCAKYIYLYNESVTLYNKVSFVNINVLININEQCIFLHVGIVFVNVG